MTPEQRKRFTRSISKWSGTPYRTGQSTPGRLGGVDCVRLCDCVLQDTLGLTLEPLPRHAADSAFHSREVVQEVTRLLFSRFDLYTVRDPLEFKPCDIIVARQRTTEDVPTDSEGHHILLAGPARPLCYDAWPNVGVRTLGEGAVRASFDVLKVYRTRLIHDQQAN